VLVNITSGPSLGIREATQATSVIQKEAGEDVEVIFGTVIDEDIEDKLRVTVIATGFDRDREPEENGEDVRRTVPLEDQEDDEETAQYKGENNLRQLDTPAYERRSAPLRSQQADGEPTDEASKTDEDGEEDDTPNVRRLEAEDLGERKDRDERSRSDEEEDTDTPAFLRKMMD
jgi:cell division protein FtsZ